MKVYSEALKEFFEFLTKEFDRTIDNIIGELNDLYGNVDSITKKVVDELLEGGFKDVEKGERK